MMLMMLLALQAQLPPAVPETKPVCVLIEPANAAENASDTPIEIQAVCGEQGVVLGAAQRHRSAYHAASRSLLVEMTGKAGKHVLLVTLDGDGVPHVDDVTRELTRLSGRYAEAGLADVAVDMNGFAATGVVSVPVTVYPAPDFSRFATRNGAAPAKSAPSAARTTNATPIVVAAAGGTAVLDLKPYAARIADTTSEKTDDPTSADVTPSAR